ncbi:ABC transporter substrate-binding protein [Pseudarthrobacter sp. J64]|uniref:ABC transporter substrate-binding protein n=1 Tax=Pseudarthrobacter sp. J64 TaxID=3116485 RepID=UPI002E81391E|nr:ABC transporter substrate-binding protein [Pseudarthrobacter sp. J64]MEE2570058.1 ABC transporter substrate-binding protein [Pseudarthrobacter sp. J64]
MSQPIDVGSVLGGRYKVTATVLTSHDQDLVLDGVDQVLNRPVSILVAGPSNNEQVAASAREVATGQRPGSVQVLDLGVSEDTTYLITNHTSAAELLDLLVAPNPPYVEPFFTDTLGSEIFGQPRSHEPEEDHDGGAGYIRYQDSHPSQVSPYPAAAAVPVPPVPTTRPSSAVPAAPEAPPSGPSTEPTPAAAASPESRPADAHREKPADADQTEEKAPGTPAYGTAAAAGAAGAAAVAASSNREEASPKVSLWSEDDYANDSRQDAAEDTDPERDRPAAAFPAFARSATAGAGAGAAAVSPAVAEYDDDVDDDGKEPRSMRWLVGGLLAVVLIAGLVFALTHLGSLFPSGEPVANEPTQSTPAATEATPGEATPTSSAPAAVTPVIESITRQGQFDFASTYDVDLVKAYDGNPASFWSNMEFATENWGGLVQGGVPLVIKLQEPSTVSSITLTQLGASGGRINVLTNDRPSLEGAKQVGTNSFTSTDLTMPLAAPVTAQYVIVQIDTLPRLAVPKTQYSYGLRLAEVRVQ